MVKPYSVDIKKSPKKDKKLVAIFKDRKGKVIKHAGFLSAKKMPMRKHEMVYVFYEKLPFYDLSSHTHKFLKSSDNIIDGDTYNTKHRKKPITREPADKYDPPLPVSVVKEDKNIIANYMEMLKERKKVKYMTHHSLHQLLKKNHNISGLRVLLIFMVVLQQRIVRSVEVIKKDTTRPSLHQLLKK
jgi:hypothetical protein